MNDKIRELLSNEIDTVEKSKLEKTLSEEEQKRLTDNREVERILSEAKAKGMELNNVIANLLIDKYIKVQSEKRYPYEHKIDYSIRLVDMKNEERDDGNSSYEHIDFEYDLKDLSYNEEYVKEALNRVNKKKTPLVVWYYYFDNKYFRHDAKRHLTLLDVEFYKKQNIKFKKDYYASLVFDDEALTKFVENVLARKFSEVTLDDKEIEEAKKKVDEITMKDEIYEQFCKKSQKNAEKLALELCKEAINEYKKNPLRNEFTLKDRSKERGTDAVDNLESEEEKSMMYTYEYYHNFIGIGHMVDKYTLKYYLMLDKDLYKTLKELGIHCNMTSCSCYFTVDVPEFEKAVLNANEEEKTAKKV